MIHLALGDAVAGCYAAAALVTAILHQQRTGEGQFVDLSQVEALLTLGIHGIAQQILLGEMPARMGSRHPEYAPQGVYRCRGEDEWLTLSIESDAQWSALVQQLGVCGAVYVALLPKGRQSMDGGPERTRLDTALVETLDEHALLDHEFLDLRVLGDHLFDPFGHILPGPG